MPPTELPHTSVNTYPTDAAPIINASFSHYVLHHLGNAFDIDTLNQKSLHLTAELNQIVNHLSIDHIRPIVDLCTDCIKTETNIVLCTDCNEHSIALAQQAYGGAESHIRSIIADRIKSALSVVSTHSDHLATQVEKLQKENARLQSENNDLRQTNENLTITITDLNEQLGRPLKAYLRRNSVGHYSPQSHDAFPTPEREIDHTSPFHFSLSPTNFSRSFSAAQPTVIDVTVSPPPSPPVPPTTSYRRETNRTLKRKLTIDTESANGHAAAIKKQHFTRSSATGSLQRHY